MNDAITSDARLPELLAARAHAASSQRLRIDVLGGLLGATIALGWRPTGWVVLLGAGLCFATFGGWGLADRAIESRSILDQSTSRQTLTIVRGLLAVVGTLAAAMTAFGVLMLALGTWIS